PRGARDNLRRSSNEQRWLGLPARVPEAQIASLRQADRVVVNRDTQEIVVYAHHIHDLNHLLDVIAPDLNVKNVQKSMETVHMMSSTMSTSGSLKTPVQKKSSASAVWKKAITRASEWDEKDEFLDVIYWFRQLIGIILGVCWGFIPFQGIFGIILFLAANVAVVYVYSTSFQKEDEENYGGFWELSKEGLMASFTGFLVSSPLHQW
ncbi:unnamed protein product, partial [Darwinula stevensoni]